MRVTIADATGRLVAEENDVSQVRYSIDKLPAIAGTYFIGVSAAGGQVSKVKVTILP